MFDNIQKKPNFGLSCKIFTDYGRFVLNIGKSNVLGSNLDYKNRIISITLGYKFYFEKIKDGTSK